MLFAIRPHGLRLSSTPFTVPCRRGSQSSSGSTVLKKGEFIDVPVGYISGGGGEKRAERLGKGVRIRRHHTVQLQRLAQRLLQ